MKMFNLNCPRCGKFFYGDRALIQLKTPVHCPKCDGYLPFEEYSPALEGKSGTALARLNKPLTKENMYEVLYVPGK
jgi:hypothetical protein